MDNQVVEKWIPETFKNAFDDYDAGIDAKVVFKGEVYTYRQIEDEVAVRDPRFAMKILAYGDSYVLDRS
jgi:hypothetical protein